MTDESDRCLKALISLKNAYVLDEKTSDDLEGKYGDAAAIAGSNKCIFLMYALEVMHIAQIVEIIERCSEEYSIYLSRQDNNRSSETDTQNQPIIVGYPQKVKILKKDDFIKVLDGYIIYKTLIKAKTGDGIHDRYFDESGWGIYCPTFYQTANKNNDWKTFFEKKINYLRKNGGGSTVTWEKYFQSLPLPLFPAFISNGSIIEFMGIQRKGSDKPNKLWNNRNFNGTELNWVPEFNNFKRMNLFFASDSNIFPPIINDSVNDKLFALRRDTTTSSAFSTPSFASMLNMTSSPSQQLHAFSFSTPLSRTARSQHASPALGIQKKAVKSYEPPSSSLMIATWDYTIRYLQGMEKGRICELQRQIQIELTKESAESRHQTRPRERRSEEIESVVKQYIEDEDSERERAFQKYVNEKLLDKSIFPVLHDFGRGVILSTADWNKSSGKTVSDVLKKFKAFLTMDESTMVLAQGTYNHFNNTWNKVLYAKDIRNVIQTLYQILYTPEFLTMKSEEQHRLKFLISVLREMGVFACKEFRIYTLRVLKCMVSEICASPATNLEIDSFNINDLVKDLEHVVNLIRFSWRLSEKSLSTTTGDSTARLNRQNIFVDIDNDDLKCLTELPQRNSRNGDISDYIISRHKNEEAQIKLALEGFALSLDPPFEYYSEDDADFVEEGIPGSFQVLPQSILGWHTEPVVPTPATHDRYNSKQRARKGPKSSEEDQKLLAASWREAEENKRIMRDLIGANLGADGGGMMDDGGGSGGMMADGGGSGGMMDDDAEKMEYYKAALDNQTQFLNKYLRHETKVIYHKLCESLDCEWTIDNPMIRNTFYATVNITIPEKRNYRTGAFPLPLLAVSIKLQEKAMNCLRTFRLNDKLDVAVKCNDYWTIWIINNMQSISNFWRDKRLPTLIPVHEEGSSGLTPNTSFHGFELDFIANQNFINNDIAKPYISQSLKNPWLEGMKKAKNMLAQDGAAASDEATGAALRQSLKSRLHARARGDDDDDDDDETQVTKRSKRLNE